MEKLNIQGAAIDGIVAVGGGTVINNFAAGIPMLATFITTVNGFTAGIGISGGIVLGGIVALGIKQMLMK